MSLDTVEKPTLEEQVARLNRRIEEIGSLQQINRATVVTVGTGDLNTDFSDPQDAEDFLLSKGGGTMFVRNGTYVRTSDHVKKSGVNIECESLGGVIWAFVGGAKMSIQGSGVYDTGTISISKGDVQVVGVGTSWLANLTTSHKIVLNGTPYSILSIDDDTHITLTVTYFGPDISGATYYAAIMLENFAIRNLIIANGGGAVDLIDLDYTDLYTLEKVIVSGALNDNLNFFRAHRPILDTVVSDGAGRDAFNMLECPQVNLTRAIATNAVRRGFMLEDVSELVALSSPAQNCGGAGWYSKDSVKQNILSSEGRGCEYGLYVDGGKGINFLDGAAQDSEKSGVKLTGNTERSRVKNATLTDNGEYGIEIDSGSDDNWVKDNDTENNVSGPTDDNGTGNTLVDNKP